MDFLPAPDSISCGPGLDAIVADDADDLPADCEALDPPVLDGEVSIVSTPQVRSKLDLSTLRAWSRVENRLGDDQRESPPTRTVRSAFTITVRTLAHKTALTRSQGSTRPVRSRG